MAELHAVNAAVETAAAQIPLESEPPSPVDSTEAAVVDDDEEEPECRVCRGEAVRFWSCRSVFP